MNKYMFFDIDGTLLDGGKFIPPSTIEAIHSARKKGNKAFICSGRSLSMLPKPVLDIGFDGIVCGGGTYISVGDKIIKQHALSVNELSRITEWFLKKPVGCFFEGDDYIYTLPLSHYRYPDRLGAFLKILSAPKKVFDPDHLEEIHAAKFSGMILPEYWDFVLEMAEDIKDFMRLVIHNEPNEAIHEKYMKECHTEAPREGDNSGDGFVEFLPQGTSKAIGIKELSHTEGFDLTDAYCFGDSENDREMMEEIPNSICMGNGLPQIKEIASYVTSDILDDGIMNAMKHYDLM